MFLKRHKVPRADGQGTYHWTDLNLRIEVDIYSWVYRIYDCDSFTREFFEFNQVALNAPEQSLDDNFLYSRMMLDMKQIPPDLAETKEYFEVKLKGGKPNKKLDKYIANDWKVLSFTIVWNDTSYDGGEKTYTLNYFLSDSTIEVKEIKVNNSGIDPFPMLLKRMAVPKWPVLTHYPGMSLKQQEFYQPSDLLIGNVIHIYGRDVQLVDCDEYTKQWYLQNMGVEQNPLPTKLPPRTLIHHQVPEHNGIGSEEDTFQNISSLQPKWPPIDVKKVFQNDIHILRFKCKLVSSEPDDENRVFTLSFFCGDDTIMVYEICDKNSGRIGGKFMERKKHKNGVTGQYYQQKDFLVGKTIYLNSYRLQIVEADEYTEKYMEDNPEIF